MGAFSTTREARCAVRSRATARFGIIGAMTSALLPWRPEDEALLTRLEDEALYAAVWRSHAGERAPSPSPRAPGLVNGLRELGGAKEAFAMAAGGRLDAVTSMMTPASFEGYPAPVLHHLALHFSRVATVRESEPAERARALLSWELSLAAFFGLAGRKDYLQAFVRDALGPRAKGTDVERLARTLPFELLEKLGERALRGARDLGTDAVFALEALARVPRAAERSSASPELRSRATARAEALRARAVDEALEPIAQVLDDANVTNEITTRGVAALKKLVPIWEATQRDEAVERFFVERAEPVCWEIQRRKEWEKFETLLGTDPRLGAPHAVDATFRLVESLIARISADRSKVAYAAACAQFLVFYSNVVGTLDRQIAVTERALLVCPSHRNGRAVLASFLCQKARRALDVLLVTEAVSNEATALVARARELFPAAKELEETEALIARKKAGLLGRSP